MIKKLWHRISQHRQENPNQSIRKAAKELGVSKDMVYRQDKRKKRRTQYSESEFWNSEAGQSFLKRLIVGTIYTFGIKGGVGAGRIEEFMNHIRISTHAGVSESSIYRMTLEIEAAILRYKELQEQGLEAQAALQKEELEVVLGADETWLDNMLLVCQELRSSYIFLNKSVKNEESSNGIPPSNPA